jgi:ketosteroid isomerase-like protein
MKKLSWIIVMQLLIHNLAFSQTGSLEKEINEQVWKPFIKAFNSGDNEAFSAVHSKDVIRVIQDNNQVMGYDQYFQKIPDSIKTKWADWKKTIELRFLQRIASKDKAFEVGYYKTTSANTVTGEKRTGFGKFHVLLRKENGVWKILMDADAHEETNEAVFLTGKPME